MQQIAIRDYHDGIFTSRNGSIMQSIRSFNIPKVTIALIGLIAVQFQALPSEAQQTRAAPLSADYAYGPRCPFGYQYACWHDPYGQRFCSCWQGGDAPACPTGYRFTCRYGPNGQRNCACY